MIERDTVDGFSVDGDPQEAKAAPVSESDTRTAAGQGQSQSLRRAGDLSPGAKSASACRFAGTAAALAVYRSRHAEAAGGGLLGEPLRHIRQGLFQCGGINAAAVEFIQDEESYDLKIYIVMKFGASIKKTTSEIIDSVYENAEKILSKAPRSVTVIVTGVLSKNIAKRHIEVSR